MDRSTAAWLDVKLVPTDDPEYVGFMRRQAELRPGRGGPRMAGEYLGGLVERCVRHWLAAQVPLQEERILTWEQRLRNGRYGRLYRELDGVWRIDTESLCLYEMKLTYAENMERGVGLKQLGIAQEILLSAKQNKYVLQRLVYVAEEPITVLEDIPALAPGDEYEALGVVWVPPHAVVTAAEQLELVLPGNWLEPESREGIMDDPEREWWREFSDTGAKPESAAGPDVTAAPEPAGSLADALRRALNPGGE